MNNDYSTIRFGKIPEHVQPRATAIYVPSFTCTDNGGEKSTERYLKALPNPYRLSALERQTSPSIHR